MKKPDHWPDQDLLAEMEEKFYCEKLMLTIKTLY